MKKNLNSVKIEISGIVYNYPIDIPIPRRYISPNKK
jgi:hypothetical protein